MALPLAHYCKGWTSPGNARELTLVVRTEDWADQSILQLPRLRSRVICWSTPTATQSVVCWNKMGMLLVLWTQGCRISMTQGSIGMSRKNPSEDPVSMIQQRPGPHTRPVIVCNECLGGKVGIKGFVVWLTVSHCSSHDKTDFSFLLS